MERKTKETFTAYATECNWFMFYDTSTPMGQQSHYVTPAGEIVIAQFDLNGKLSGMSPPPIAAIPMPQRIPGIDLLSGRHSP